MNFYKGKKCLVTGGTGLIGRPLSEMLLEAGAEVTIISLDDPSRAPKGSTFLQLDLRELSNCMQACNGQEIVFHLAGVKGSPAMTRDRPASFFVPTISFNTNMMEAARLCNVERYLYTSSIGVYAPMDVFHEDDVWSGFPSPNDKFAGWAKRMGELQAEAYKIEYNWNKISIVRPANVYGPYDNFNPESCMVIPALISRIGNGEDPLRVWGDGSALRDFIYSKDVARGMMFVVEKGINKPVNLGSGVGVSIREIVETIKSHDMFRLVEIEWDTSKPSGDKIRIMDTKRMESYGFSPKTSIKEGISETIDWYLKNLKELEKRYIAFNEKP